MEEVGGKCERGGLLVPLLITPLMSRGMSSILAHSEDTALWGEVGAESSDYFAAFEANIHSENMMSPRMV